MTNPPFRSILRVRGRRGASAGRTSSRSIRSLALIAVAVSAMVGAALLPASSAAPAQALSTAAVPSLVGAAGGYMHDADAAWVRPVPGKVTSWFGPRPIICNSAGCSTSIHEGVDFGSPCGTSIKAVSPGRVIFAGDGGAFGQRVIIDHGAGVASLYGHAQLGSIAVSVGQQVSAGTVVSKVGATGVATGCHLDLKIRVGGVYIDPTPWMKFRGVTL